jgi:hypothetical protein
MVIRAYPVQDLVVPLAQVGQAIQAESQQVLLALGPDPLKTSFQLLMLNGMYNGGFYPVPGVSPQVQLMTALQMQAAGQLAAASALSNGYQQLGNGFNALTGGYGGFGSFGGGLGNFGSNADLVRLIQQVVADSTAVASDVSNGLQQLEHSFNALGFPPGGFITIGTPHFGGTFPYGLGGFGYGGGGLGFGALNGFSGG